MKTTGRVNGIISNIVIVKADGPVGQNEICHVYCGDTKMMAEVIKVVGDNAYVQVFDSTRGLKIGEKVEFEGHMLEVTLAPGLLSRNYDGLQNDLEKMDGLFIAVGQAPQSAPFQEAVAVENGYYLAGEDTKTSLPGVFAAGDGRKKQVRQLTTAVSDGAAAALAACRYLEEQGQSE